MLIGLLQPTAGAIEVDGIDVIRTPAPGARPHRLHGAEGQPLPGPLAARERRVLRRPLRARRRRRSSARWGALRERFALGEVEREKPEDLPAGIRQRAGLALSTLHQPRVLFLDEPTAGVDVHNRGLFWELIQDEADAGVTVFVTTHFLEEVDYCDWVCFIDAGRLIANATPEDAAPALLRRLPDRRRRCRPTARAPRAAALARRRRRRRPTTATASSSPSHALDAGARATLGARCGARRRRRVHVEQPPMTDVFRRVLARAGGARA